MMVYIIGFAVSVLLIYYAESKRFRSGESRVCVFLALMIPCLIAGLRADTIGTDVLVYVEPLFRVARSSQGFWDFYRTEFYQAATWNYVFVHDFEIGFDILCYVCAKIFGSMPMLLFAIQAFTIIPIYLGLRTFKKEQPVWLGMTVYYLMFFNNTLNMMRQWIAMAFLCYGFKFLISKNYRRYVLVICLALLFHTSAVFGAVILLFFRLTVEGSTYQNKRNAILLATLGVIALLSVDFLAATLHWMGSRYANYLSGTLSLLPRQVLYRIPILLLLVLRWKYLKQSNQLAFFYTLMVTFDLIASQLISVFVYSGRIGIFFSEYYMLAYPAICRASSSAKNRQALRWFTVCYLCLYWWYVYAYGGTSATVPYRSIFG